jgi:hypothetical protein
MIRLFLNLCKCFHLTKSSDDYQVYISYTDNALTDTISCPSPSCGQEGNYYGCGSYSRLLICYTNACVERHEITIPRIECVSCGHSHSLLAPVIIPYSPFSFHFVISLLYDYITHKYNTVSELCQVYDISVSTLYRIFHRFTEDRKLMLGMMEAAVSQSLNLLDSFKNNSFIGYIDHKLKAFFKNNQASFLQARCRIRLFRNVMQSTSASSP